MVKSTYRPILYWLAALPVEVFWAPATVWLSEVEANTRLLVYPFPEEPLTAVIAGWYLAALGLSRVGENPIEWPG